MTTTIATTEALVAAALGDEPRYASGTAFVDATSRAFGTHAARYMREGRPFVVVLPAGEELRFTPRPGALGRVLRTTARLVGFRAVERLGPLVQRPGQDAAVDVRLRPVPGFEQTLHSERPVRRELEPA